jgi:Domain of unknown function (DUF3854)/Family of unknown function (DUF5906)
MLTLPQVRAAMLEKLKGSALTAKHAKILRLEPLTETLAAEAGVSPPWAGFRIPYFTPDGKIIPDFFRYRFWPESRPSRGFAALAPPSDLRYVQPKGSELHVYMPPLLDDTPWRAVVDHVNIPLFITEGELKAACVCANTPHAMLGLGGVFSWMSKRQAQDLIPALAAFKWEGREVYIVFDSDRARKPLVQLAASRLAVALTARGARVWDVFLPPPPSSSPEAAATTKQGVDDLIAAHGPAAFDALLKEDADPPTCVQVIYSLELHRLNEEVAFIWSGGAAGNVVRYADAQIMPPERFTRAFYRDRVFIRYGVTKEGKALTSKAERAADAWLEWPCRAQVASITYAPGAARITDANEFNIWKDDGVAPKRGSVAPFLDLVARVLAPAKPDSQAVTWFLRWLAYPVQNPGAKLFSCVLLWSLAGGTGKNLLLETMEPIYGPSNYVVIKSRHLLSEFNGWVEGKQFVVGDEITLDDKRHTSGDLKAMITSRKVRVNRKGIEAYEVPDCANYALTSNDPISLNLDQGERRTFVLHASETPIGDSYGTAYADWLRNRDGAAFVKRHLLDLALGDFAPAAPPPETEAKDELIAYSRSDVDAWTVALAQDPERTLSGPSVAKFGVAQPVRKVYTPEDLMRLYDPEGRTRTSFKALGLAMSRAGFRKSRFNNGRLGSYRATFWILDPALPHLSSTAAAKLYVEERAPAPPGSRKTAEEKRRVM